MPVSSSTFPLEQCSLEWGLCDNPPEAGRLTQERSHRKWAKKATLQTTEIGSCSENFPTSGNIADLFINPCMAKNSKVSPDVGLGWAITEENSLNESTYPCSSLQQTAVVDKKRLLFFFFSFFFLRILLVPKDLPKILMTYTFRLHSSWRNQLIQMDHWSNFGDVPET